MTNQEIIDNAPEGWTHHVLDNGTNFYFKLDAYTASVWSGDWDSYIQAKDSLPDIYEIRSRKDIEQLVKLEHDKAQATTLFAQLYQILGVYDAPVNVMDAVSDAQCGNFKNVDLLPFTIDEVK